MLKKIVLIVAATAAIAMASYSVIPKYEMFVSGGPGSVTYRFNKISGDLEYLSGDKWQKEKSAAMVGIKHPGTFKDTE